MKIFLDANILFSASRGRSIVRRFVEFLSSSGHVLVTNDYARAEAERNILIKKFTTEQEFLELMKTVQCSNVLIGQLIEGLAEKDQPIMRGALGLACEYLLTSDRKDFGNFMSRGYKNLIVGTPAMLAAFLNLERRRK